MKATAFMAMALVFGLAQAGSVQADEPLTEVTTCSKNIDTLPEVYDSCSFKCLEGYYIEWTGTASATLKGYAACGGQQTPECTVTVLDPPCTERSPNPVGQDDSHGRCYGSGQGFISCKNVPAAGV